MKGLFDLCILLVFTSFFAMNLHRIFKMLKNNARSYRVWVFGVFLSPYFISELKIAQQTTKITDFVDQIRTKNQPRHFLLLFCWLSCLVLVFTQRLRRTRRNTSCLLALYLQTKKREGRPVSEEVRHFGYWHDGRSRPKFHNLERLTIHYVKTYKTNNLT